MSTATQTISWPVLLSKICKLGYTGDDCIDDVRAWIEKRYDAITVNGKTIGLDELEQIGLKHVEEHICGTAQVDRNAKVNPISKAQPTTALAERFDQLSADFDQLLPSCYRFKGQPPTGDRRADAWASADERVRWQPSE